MRRAGTVVRIAQGRLIVQSPDSDYPPIGAPLLDDALETVGRVVDVFGPVDRPYLTVVPDDSVHLPALLNAPLYLRY